jgi:uncharacterized protein YukE
MSSSSQTKNQKIEESIKWMTAELEEEWERIGDSNFENTQVASVFHIKELNESIQYLKTQIKQFL